MNKKIISLVLCVVMLLTLVSCSGQLGKDDLKNKNIGVIRGSQSIPIAKVFSEEQGCTLTAFYNPDEFDKAFDSGTIDCAILDRNIANSFVKEYTGYTVSQDSVGEGHLTFSTLETKKIYKIMLDKALAALKEDGTLDEIVNGYLSDEAYEYELSKERDNSNGEFIIALDTEFLPYTTDDGLNITGGLAVAVIDAVCVYLGCDYTILPITTSSMATALRTGTADFTVGSFDDQMNEYFKDTPIIESEPILTYDYAIVSKK